MSKEVADALVQVAESIVRLGNNTIGEPRSAIEIHGEIIADAIRSLAIAAPIDYTTQLDNIAEALNNVAEALQTK
jgi:hypothetical protein